MLISVAAYFQEFRTLVCKISREFQKTLAFCYIKHIAMFSCVPTLTLLPLTSYQSSFHGHLYKNLKIANFDKKESMKETFSYSKMFYNFCSGEPQDDEYVKSLNGR